MELLVTSKGSGKYSVSDISNRLVYQVTKARKTFGNPVTTLSDPSGYTLYTMKRVSTGRKPEYEIWLNDRFFMKVLCKSMFIDPSIQFESDAVVYELKGKEHMHFELYRNDESIGTLEMQQVDCELIYRLVFDDQYFDDFFPLFAVTVDKCFGGIK